MKSHKYYDKFVEAQHDEINSHYIRASFNLIKPPEGRKLLAAIWVFDYKLDMVNGVLIKFKARMVAGGHTQTEGVDYNETFSPVVRQASVRLMLVIAMILGLQVEQLDVVTAFLYGQLEEPNYMKCPPGFEQYDEDGNPLCWEIVKSIYGLHQSSREWFKVVHTYLESLGYTPSVKEPCLYFNVKIYEREDIVTKERLYILVYVDDFLVMGSTKEIIDEFKTNIKSQFEIKDLGQAKVIIGLTHERIGDGVYIGQQHYAQQVLRDFGMWDTETKEGIVIPIDIASTPMSVGWIHDEKSKPLDPKGVEFFRSIVMSLMYLATNTRPDLSFATNLLSGYQTDAREHDLRAAHRILRYLRGTWDFGLFYRKSSVSATLFVDAELQAILETIVAYADASWAQERGRKSRGGFVFIFMGAALIWNCSQQKIIALSSTESELYTFSDCAKDALWLRQILAELQIHLSKPTEIRQDNKSTIAVVMNPVNHKMTKHIEVRTMHFRDNITKGELSVAYCPTEDMIADIFTKALDPKTFWKFVELLGLRSLADLRGESVIHLTEDVELAFDKE